METRSSRSELWSNVRSCRTVLDRIGDKWTVLIIAALKDEPKRFNETRRLLGGISHRVLTLKLRDLERDGYVARTVYPVSPPRVEYALTPLGRSVLMPIEQFLAWTVDAYPHIQLARKAFDGAGGSPATKSGPGAARRPS